MNFIDKAVGLFNPEAQLKRTVARKKLEILNSGYSHHGASESKKNMLGWNSDSYGPDEDIHKNLDKLRQRSRDLYYGAPLATGAIKTIRTNVVGEGLKCKPAINRKYLKMSEEEARNWNENTEFEFRLWAESVHCDSQRQNNFYELTGLAFASQLMNGETLATLPMIPRMQLPYDIRVMLIAADRLGTPGGDYVTHNKIKFGIESNENGEIVAYHIANKHPGTGLSNDVKYKRIPKYGETSGRVNILHLMETEHIGQKRGVGILAPVIESLKQLSRYTAAEIDAAVISAFFTVFIENKSTHEMGALGADSGYEVDDDEDEEEPQNLKLSPGAILELAEGQQVKDVNPSRPNNGFSEFVKAICIQIGAALELPYEILLKDFNKSYSASRASMLQAWKMFKMRRTWLSNDFCQPVYEEWLSEAVSKGRIHAPGFFDDPAIRKAYCTAEWHGPAQGQIDPLKEVNASIKRVENGFSTREKETTELTGGDFKNNMEVAEFENKAMIKAGLKEDPNAKEILGS